MKDDPLSGFLESALASNPRPLPSAVGRNQLQRERPPGTPCSAFHLHSRNVPEVGHLFSCFRVEQAVAGCFHSAPLCLQ